VVRSFRASKTALAAATLDRWLPALKISSSNAEGTMGEGRRRTFGVFDPTATSRQPNGARKALLSPNAVSLSSQTNAPQQPPMREQRTF
jgi:hypothetical protein